MDNFIEPLKELVKGLTKKAETQPGWLYLLILTYIAVGHFGVPQRVTVGHWSLALPKLSNEIWVALITYVGYQVGDVLDKITFKKRENGEWVQRYTAPAMLRARRKARRRLGIQGGSYDVSMRVLEAAKEGTISVHVINESSKCFRSLIVPGYIALLILAYQPVKPGVSLKVVVGATALAIQVSQLAYVVAYHIYPWMKRCHITNLYRATASIIRGECRRDAAKRRLWIHNVGEIRMFFWDDLPIASARLPPNAEGGK